MAHRVTDSILLEQRYVIRYLYRKEMTPAETVEEMRRVYKNQCYDESSILQLHKRYKDICSSTSSKHRTVSVEKEKVQEALSLVNKNKKITMKQISEALGITLSMAFTVMVDHLGMTMVDHKWTRFDEGNENTTNNAYLDVLSEENDGNS